VRALTPAQRAVATFGLAPTADSPDEHPPGTAGPRTTGPGTTGSDPVEPDAAELGELITWAQTERLDGLLWSALTAGRIRTPSVGDRAVTEVEEALDGARDAHLSGLRSSLAAEATGVAAVAALTRAGIEPILFKGLANAHLDYDRPEHRTFFDADLLVERDEFAAAVEVLVAAGFTRATPPLRERWERRFARAIELRSPDGVEVDLHASLATGYFGEILDHDALRNEAGPGASTVHLAGVDHRCFGPAGRLLISGYAIVLSRGPGIRLVRDLAQQLVVTGADWQHAVRLAGDGECVLAAALLETARQLGIHHDAVEWARTVTPSPAAARALAYAGDAHHQGWSADARSTMLALGPLERIRFLGGVVLPSRANLRARGRTVTAHLSRSTTTRRDSGDLGDFGDSGGSHRSHGSPDVGGSSAPSQADDHER
jgi:hypothetical protein